MLRPCVRTLPCPSKKVVETLNRVCALHFIIFCLCSEDTEEARKELTFEDQAFVMGQGRARVSGSWRVSRVLSVELGRKHSTEARQQGGPEGVRRGEGWAGLECPTEGRVSGGLSSAWILIPDHEKVAHMLCPQFPHSRGCCKDWMRYYTKNIFTLLGTLAVSVRVSYND